MISKNTIIAISFFLVFGCSTDSPNSFSHRLPESYSFNLGYEDLNEDGTPAEWLFLGPTSKIDVVQDDDISLEGDKYLHIASEVDTQEKMYCLNTIITDVITNNLTISVSVVVPNNSKLSHGLFYQSQGQDTLGMPVFINADQVNNSDRSNWTSQTMIIPLSEILGDFLVFGYWMEGEGEVWLDDWRLSVDNHEYNVAVEKKIPALSKSAQAYIRNESVHLKKMINGEEQTNYSWLPTAIGNSNVVLLGEDTHGTHEFAVLKTEISKYLIKNMGFSTIAIEANLPEVEYLNEHLKKGISDKELIREVNKLNFWMYRTTEFLSFLRWVNTYNVTHNKKIRLTGCDLQYYKFAILELNRFIGQIPDLQLTPKLDSLNNTSLDYNSSIRLAESIRSDVRLCLNQHSTKRTKPLLDRMIRYCTIIIDALTLRNKRVPHHFRDKQMAANIEWLTKDPASNKVIVWAHNDHIANNAKAIGYWLGKNGVVGNTFSLGMTSGSGTYNGVDTKTGQLKKGDLKSPTLDSWEYLFKASGAGDIYLDISDENSPLANYPHRRTRSIGASITPKQFIPAYLSKKFDGIIYLDSTSATNFY